MKIAVLMSTYNGEKYLREQIESILAQEVNCEVDLIVRDDGSNDLTQNILEEYAAQGKLNWYTGENLNAAGSFMHLLKNTIGYDFYAFADQDDYWDKDKLSSAINMIKGSEAPMLYFANAEVVDAGLKSLGRVVYKHTPQYDFKTITCAGGLLGCTMVFNQNLASLIQDKEMPDRVIMHDYYVAIVCLGMNGQIVYDQNSHMKYRQHSNNVVGVSYGIWQKVRDRFFDIKIKSKVSIADQAQTILRIYKKELPKEHGEWLDYVSDYRKSIFKRIGMAFTRKTKYNSYNMAFKIRMKLLLGNK